VADKTEVERNRAMAVDGRRVGRIHGKRHIELLVHDEARQALWQAITAEQAGCHDAWGTGYVEGLRDTLREQEGKRSLARLDWDD
jgi:hypothetical protein